MTEQESVEDIPKVTSEEQEIGNSDLISSLLSQRIAETPTARVPEVEVPDPSEELAKEITETLVIEEEKPEVVEPDPKEYEEKPAPIQLVKPEEAKKDASSDTATPVSEELSAEELERKARRRAMTAKWGIRMYDKMQGLISVFTYDKLNTPQTDFTRRTELMEKVYSAKLAEKEREELKKLNELYEAFIKRRSNYAEKVHMSEEMRADIQELTEDLMSISKREVNPVYILALLLLLPVMSNMITAFSHKMQYNTKF
jgi:hypothetical protein